MTKILTALYDSFDDASAAARQLETAKLPDIDISIVANNSDSWYEHQEFEDTATGEAAGAGAGVGAALGGASGLLAGLGILAIPGVGPVVAAGWLAATVAGAAAGAVAGGATGGIIGALMSEGVPAHEAGVYAESVRRGSTLVSVRVPDTLEAEVKSILAASTRVNVAAHAQAYRDAGRTDFDPAASPCDADQAPAKRK